MVNMMGNKKILSLIVITSIILAGIAISFYKIPNADAFGSGNNNNSAFAVSSTALNKLSIKALKLFFSSEN